MNPTTIATCCNKMQFNAGIMLIKAMKGIAFRDGMCIFVCLLL